MDDPNSKSIGGYPVCIEIHITICQYSRLDGPTRTRYYRGYYYGTRGMVFKWLDPDLKRGSMDGYKEYTLVKLLKGRVNGI